MKPGEVATFLAIGRSTVTTWTNGEFKPYFTPTAQGGTGGERSFSDRDVRIMYLIKLRKDAGISAQRIHSELQALRDHEWDGLPDLPASSPSAVVPVMPVAAADAALASERRGLLQEISLLQTTVAELKADLNAERGKQEKLLREIAELERRLGRSDTLVELYEQGRLKPKE